MSEEEYVPDLDSLVDTGSNKVLEELLEAAAEVENREREMYMPFNMIQDPRVRAAIIMLARKYADMTENFAQSLARKAEDYGIMMLTSNLEKPTQDGIILVVKFQIVGVRGDILKARYNTLKRIARSVKFYKSTYRLMRIGDMSEPGSEPGYGGADTGSHTSPDSEENTAEGGGEEYNGSGPYSAGDSESSGRVIVL